MPKSARFTVLSLAGLMALGPVGCRAPHQNNQALRQSQYRAMQLHQQNQALAAENQQTQIAAQQSQQLLQQQLAAMQASQSTLEQRLENLQGERAQLQQRYMSLINSVKQNGSPLSPGATQELEDLKARYPDFDFDPQTGVSKFHSDILFASGSSEIRTEASPMLQEFAEILNRGDSQSLNILVVGHTDDKPIVKSTTKARHGDNWDLSAHRAVSVTRLLSKMGMRDNRMGVAGYGPHQPLVPNKDDAARARNRRVEIFVLAPNAAVAGRDLKKSY